MKDKFFTILKLMPLEERLMGVGMIKKILKFFGITLLIFVAFLAVFLLVSTVLEYRPADVYVLDVTGSAGRSLESGDSLTILAYNIGYAALSADQDFFMDGGSMVRPAEKAIVERNMAGILKFIAATPADIYLLQEVDINSKRSYRINQVEQFINKTGMNAAFAYNFNSIYTPFPIPMIGKVESGLLTLTNLEVKEATRVSLPVPFKWPIRLFNLKRCLLVERVPAGEKELVLVNFHLEAYDDGEGKREQLNKLMALLIQEYQKGNYVIAGGDFNHIFPGAAYPDVYPELWVPGELDESMLPEGWQFAFDASVPTCRLLNKPFSGNYEDTQLYVIDGYILSPNVRLDFVQTIDTSFDFSDHHPVLLKVTLE
ncbi:MAG: endonuclease [Lachnospiraceae bacterium]|nr:endonuclease [Lachnospiraceae bacterium]